MINAGFNQIDSFYRSNPYFRQCILCAYYGWAGSGGNCFEEQILHLHAKNERFELMLNTGLINIDDTFNFLILDGKCYNLNVFTDWEKVEAEIIIRLQKV